jgi:hypothetical protein
MHVDVLHCLIYIRPHPCCLQSMPPDQPRIITVRGPKDAVDSASRMVMDLISGDPSSAQAIIQRVSDSSVALWA